jgi:hypothetical protein
LREYLGLPVSFYLHAWCILDPIPQSLSQLLHCCIRRGYFLMQRANGVKGLVRAIVPGV